jgi:hypothetical protein
MIKKSQSNQDAISRVLQYVTDPQKKKEVESLLQQYISGAIDKSKLVSNPTIANLYNNDRTRPLFTEIFNLRQQNLSAQRDNQSKADAQKLNEYNLLSINRKRREQGLNEFQTYEDYWTYKQKEDQENKRVVNNLYSFIAAGDGDSILASGAKYEQVKQAIDAIINNSPKRHEAIDPEHHSELITEYLRQTYHIFIENNEKVYNYFMSAIMIFYARKNSRYRRAY